MRSEREEWTSSSPLDESLKAAEARWSLDRQPRSSYLRCVPILPDYTFVVVKTRGGRTL